MRAAILESAPGELIIDEVTVDKPRPDEVLIQTTACGLCHSDLHVLDAKLPQPLPMVLGHEAAGVVQAVGDDVVGFAKGDRVVGCLSMFCGHCRECAAGATWMCENRRQLANRPDGSARLTRNDEPVNQFTGMAGFAEELLLHQNAIVKVPDELPLDLGSLLGCAVITGVGSAINGAQVRPGQTVAVVGVGGVGLNIVQGAIIAGAERVIAVDVNEQKLELARTFGATDTINGAATDAVNEIVEMTGGGVDVAFEAIGLPATTQQAFRMIRPNRTAYLVGVPAVGANIELPGIQMCLQSRGMRGLYMGSSRFTETIPMLANLYLQGRLKLEELVAERIDLDQVNRGYDTMREGTHARSVIVF